MLSSHLLLDPYVWRLPRSTLIAQLHLRKSLRESSIAALADSSRRSSSRWAFSERKTANEARRGDLADSPTVRFSLLVFSLAHSILALHAEEIARTGKHLVKDAHDAREHLRGDVLVYLGVLLVIDGLARPKDSINQAHNLVLVVFALVKTLLRAIVHSLFVCRRLREN